MDQTLIKQEFIKRKYLMGAVESYINNTFQGHPKGKLKRGIIQQEIAAFFNITKNNVFSELVNICMENAGYMCRTIRGDQYYKGVKRL